MSDKRLFMNCKNCDKELVQLPKKKVKEFCNSTCRSNFWQKQKRKKKKPSKEALSKPEYKTSSAELAKGIQSVTVVVATADQVDIENKIAAIRAEKIPPERNTVFGKKSWAIDQSKRIEELKNQLKKA